MAPQPRAAAAEPRERKGDKTCFEQQRAALVGEIAMVGGGAGGKAEGEQLADDGTGSRASSRCWPTSTSSTGRLRPSSRYVVFCLGRGRGEKAWADGGRVVDGARWPRSGTSSRRSRPCGRSLRTSWLGMRVRAPRRARSITRPNGAGRWAEGSREPATQPSMQFSTRALPAREYQGKFRLHKFNNVCPVQRGRVLLATHQSNKGPGREPPPSWIVAADPCGASVFYILAFRLSPLKTNMDLSRETCEPR